MRTPKKAPHQRDRAAVSVIKGTARRMGEAVMPWLAMAYIRLVQRTVRWQWVGREMLDGILTDRTPVIVAFWHGRILQMPPVTEESPLPVHVIISSNRDGEKIARVMRYFGGHSIRGSTRDLRRKKSDKGGRAALRSAFQKLEAGEIVAITPDGPRGPRMSAEIGVAAMSAQSGVPVLPFAWATRRARVLQSWDRFMLPWPFDRGVYVIGAPLYPHGTDKTAMEAHRQAIEVALRDVTRRADMLAGRVPVEPA